MPERIQRKRTKGWRMPENTVSVTRPGKFGNPFKHAEEFRWWMRRLLYWGERSNPGPKMVSQEAYEKMLVIADSVGELRGKNLACFCGDDRRCHADVLLEYANKESICVSEGS